MKLQKLSNLFFPLFVFMKFSRISAGIYILYYLSITKVLDYFVVITVEICGANLKQSITRILPINIRIFWLLQTCIF